MRKLIAGLALFLAACAAFSLGVSDPAPTVRVMTQMKGTEERQVCSAVVIKPDTALTARHCIFGENLRVDGLPVEQSISSTDEGMDIALLIVPGLDCPCAPLGERPAIDSEVKSIGFPGVAEGRQRVSEPAIVKFIGVVSDFISWVPEEFRGVFILASPSTLDPGDSGGGLFQRQNGRWKLVGINAFYITAPPFGFERVVSGFTPVDLAVKFIQ